MKNNLILAALSVVILFSAYFALGKGNTALLALKKPFILAQMENEPPAKPKIPAEPAMPENPDLQRFGKNLVDAIHQKDIAKRRALVDPKSLACVDKAAPKFFGQELSTSHPDWELTKTTIREHQKNFLIGLPNLAAMPENPETSAEIRWEEKKGDKSSHALFVVALRKEKNEYLQILPCPTSAEVRERDDHYKAVEQDARQSHAPTSHKPK